MFVGPNGTQDVFEADKGDVIFAPQGHYHYFENPSPTEELVGLIVFNSDAADPRTTSASITLSPPYATTCSQRCWVCPSQSSHKSPLFPAASSS